MAVDQKVSELDEADPNGSEIVFKVVQDGLDKKLTRAATGDGVLAVYSRSRTLTDAEIKALPTTALDIVPAPGSGKILVAIKCIAIFNRTDIYTNISVDSQLSLGVGSAPSMNIVAEAIQGGVSALLAGAASKLAITSTWSNETEGQDADYGWGIQSQPTNLSGIEDQPITIYGYNSGDYTGGNAANTLKVTVVYTIIDV